MVNSDSTDAARARPEVAFLFIGGVHHVFHPAPVATELSRLYPELHVACFYSDAETGAALAGAYAPRVTPNAHSTATTLPRFRSTNPLVCCLRG